MKNLLKNPHFRWLFLSVICSGVGTGITLMAVNWSLLTMFGSTEKVAQLSVWMTLASFFCLPFISSWLDQFSRKKVLASVFFIGAFSQFLFWGVGLYQGVTPSLLFSIGILSGILRASDQTTRTVLSKDLFSKDDYADLNRCLEVARQAITFLAGGLGSLLMASQHFSLVLFLDGLSFLLAGVFIYQIKTPETFLKKNPYQNLSFLKGPKEVFQFLKEHKDFALFSFITLFPFVFVVIQNILYPAHFKIFLGLEGSAFAFLSLPYGLGAITSAWMNTKLKKLFGKDLMLMIFFGVYSLAIFTIISFKGLFITYSCLFIFAFCHSSIRIERMTVLMKTIPSHLAGRMTGLFDSLALLLNIGFSLLIGFLADQWSLTSSWLFLGITLSFLTISMIFILMPKTKRPFLESSY